jgi:hypothetical protein
MCQFDQGCKQAIEAGELPHKIEVIRKLFVWYRTFGFYLGLIKKDPKIIGQYLGGGKYSTYSRDSHSYLHSNSYQQKELVTEYLFGTAQILSGILCVWLLPPCPAKWTLGASLAFKGFERIYDVTKPLLFQQDISIAELQRVGEAIKTID